jgi:hypothetical protein
MLAGATAPSHSRRRWLLCLTLGFILATSAAIRLRLVDLPLDRDEGEYAYMGRLLLDGVPPYAKAYHFKLPGIYVAYAAVMAVFGPTAAGIRLGLIMVNAATIVLLFLFARPLLGAGGGLAAAATYAVLSLSSAVLGQAAYAEHFVVLAALAGAVVLRPALDRPRPGPILAGGSLFGLAFLLKASGALFGALAVVVLLRVHLHGPTGSGRRAGQVAALFLVGAALPVAVVLVALAAAGVFPTFWFWVVHYGGHYASATSFREGARALARAVGEGSGVLWPLAVPAAAGLVAIAADPALRRIRPVLAAVALTSFLATSATLNYRWHYFILLLPAWALLAAVPVVRVGAWFRVRSQRAAVAWAVLLAVVPAGLVLWLQRDVLFRLPPAAASRAIYGRNPFPEAVEVAQYIRARTTPTQTIAVLGSEPQIYFYSSRPGATGFIYAYPLVEPNPWALDLQRRMIAEIEQASPEFIVFVSVPSSWLLGPHADPPILQWFRQYARHYEAVGILEIHRTGTRRYWDDEARDHRPRSDVWLGVYRRRSDVAERPPPAR